MKRAFHLAPRAAPVLAGLAALLLLAVLALARPDWLGQYLVDPLARMLWLAYRLYRMVDQSVYWTMLVFLAFTVWLVFLSGRGARSGPARGAAPTRLDNPVAEWEKAIRAAGESAEGRQALQQRLQALAASVNKRLDEDPPLDLGLEAGGSRRERLLARLRAVARPADTRLRQQLERILISLECKLEVPHDRSRSD